jgi:hypothetical protein
VAERKPLTDLLFPKGSTDTKPEDVADWPLETYHCTLVTSPPLYIADWQRDLGSDFDLSQGEVAGKRRLPDS